MTAPARKWLSTDEAASYLGFRSRSGIREAAP